VVACFQDGTALHELLCARDSSPSLSTDSRSLIHSSATSRTGALHLLLLHSRSNLLSPIVNHAGTLAQCVCIRSPTFGFMPQAITLWPPGTFTSHPSQHPLSLLSFPKASSPCARFSSPSSSSTIYHRRLTPAGPQKTKARVWWLVHRDAKEGKDYTLDRLLPIWQRTSEQVRPGGSGGGESDFPCEPFMCIYFP